MFHSSFYIVFGSLCDATTICSSVRRYLHFVRLCIILYLYAQHPLGRAAAHTGSVGRLRGRKEGRGRINLDIAVGDTILTRKKHPCGASSFEVLRVGMDFKIRCTGCGREVMLPRAKIEKNIKKVVKPGSAQ